MILMYHKVAETAPTPYWVTRTAFERQMQGLHDRQVVPLEDYDPGNPQHCAVTFDDAYVNVLEHAAPVLGALGYPFEVFVNSAFIGKTNTFDQPAEPVTEICDLDQLAALVAAGARLQWHTRNHADLARADDRAVTQELSVPEALRVRFPAPHFDWFSYPYGHIGPEAVRQARQRFRGAVAVANDAVAGDRHLLPRVDMRTGTDVRALLHDGPPQSRAGLRRLLARLRR